jgi:hypothetical protein
MALKTSADAAAVNPADVHLAIQALLDRLMNTVDGGDNDHDAKRTDDAKADDDNDDGNEDGGSASIDLHLKCSVDRVMEEMHTMYVSTVAPFKDHLKNSNHAHSSSSDGDDSSSMYRRFKADIKLLSRDSHLLSIIDKSTRECSDIIKYVLTAHHHHHHHHHHTSLCHEDGSNNSTATAYRVSINNARIEHTSLFIAKILHGLSSTLLPAVNWRNGTHGDCYGAYRDHCFEDVLTNIMQVLGATTTTTTTS